MRVYPTTYQRILTAVYAVTIIAALVVVAFDVIIWRN